MAEEERRGRGEHPPLMKKTASGLEPLLSGAGYASRLDVPYETLTALRRRGIITGDITGGQISLTEDGADMVRRSLPKKLTLPPRRKNEWADTERVTGLDAIEDLMHSARRGSRRGRHGVRRSR